MPVQLFWGVYPVQSTHMASAEVSEITVHACTGNPLPQDVEQIAQWLFNAPFVQAFNSAPFRPCTSRTRGSGLLLLALTSIVISESTMKNGAAFVGIAVASAAS